MGEEKWGQYQGQLGGDFCVVSGEADMFSSTRWEERRALHSC